MLSRMFVGIRAVLMVWVFSMIVRGTVRNSSEQVMMLIYAFLEAVGITLMVTRMWVERENKTPDVLIYIDEESERKRLWASKAVHGLVVASICMIDLYCVTAMTMMNKRLNDPFLEFAVMATAVWFGMGSYLFCS